MSTAGGDTAGVVSVLACWAWAEGTENIFEIFHFYPFGVPTAPTVLGVGGPAHPKFGVVVGLSLGLDKFVLDFR